MELMQLTTYMILLLSILLVIINEIAAGPYGEFDSIIPSPIRSVERFDENYYVNYQPRPNIQRNSLLSRLRRGYYYIDDGDITPVSPSQITNIASNGQRRQDIDDNLSNSVKYTPLVRYKQTKTKRKKLFVPNFFG